VTIEVQLNGETRETISGVTLDALIDQFELPKQRVAVELNRTVVRRVDWPNTAVNAGDVIEVIHFVGGG
jgi:sulfur carrier protein